MDQEVHLFYEYNHGELFERTKTHVLTAEYLLNLKFIQQGFVTLNDFYESLSLPRTDLGDVLGWFTTDEGFHGCPWIRFEWEPLEMEDGMECTIINLPVPPTI